MANPRYLANAPITEAVIDFRVRTPSALKVEELKLVGERFKGVYEKPEEMRSFEFGVIQQPGQPLKGNQVDRGLVGFRFTSTDGKHIVQFRKDGFTFSRLSPYTGWNISFEEASRLYRAYAEVAQIEEISRIAVRYINRLLLPVAEVGDFSPFLVASPPFPDEVPALITHFLTQMQVKEPDGPTQAIVTQTIQGGNLAPGFVPVILDFDVFEIGNLPAKPEEILPRFEVLRNFKNRLFFASITEKAAALFA